MRLSPAWHLKVPVLAVAIAVVATTDADRARGVQMDGAQLAALERMLETVNGGDAPGYARLYSDDAVITIYGTATLAGRGAIERHEADLMRQYPGAKLGFHSVWQQGALAVVRYAVTAEVPDRGTMGHEGLLFLRFNGAGAILAERRYQDSFTPMAQLGLLGPSPARPRPVIPSAMRVHRAGGSADEAKNAGLLRQLLAAFDSRDVRGVLALVHEEVHIDELVLPAPFVGAAGAQAWIDAWRSALANPTSDVTFALAAGDFVLAETTLRGVCRGPFGPAAASGGQVTLHRGTIAEFRNGRLKSLAAFMNGKELGAAPGAPWV